MTYASPQGKFAKKLRKEDERYSESVDKYDRYRQSMLDAGYVLAPRGYVTKEDAETIKTMLVKKTDGNGKIL